jgi:hypothetical protein
VYLPVWKRDGSGVVFMYRDPEGTNYLIWANGKGEPQPLLESSDRMVPTSWSPRGELAFSVGLASSAEDIRLLRSDGSVFEFLATDFDERQPEFSPSDVGCGCCALRRAVCGPATVARALELASSKS